MDEVKNLEESDNIKVIAGTGFYCYGKKNMGTTIGNFNLDTPNSANHLQIRVAYDTSDKTKYQLTYELNGQNDSFYFTPKNNIFSKKGSVTNFSCQLQVPANEGDGNTFCSISILEV